MTAEHKAVEEMAETAGKIFDASREVRRFVAGYVFAVWGLVGHVLRAYFSSHTKVHRLSATLPGSTEIP